MIRRARRGMRSRSVTGHWSASDAQISADLHGQVGVGADQTRRADRVDLRLGSDGAPVGSGPVLQPGDLLAEVTLLLGVGGMSGCGLVGDQRGGWVAVAFEEVGANGMEPAIAGHPRVGLESVGQVE